MGRPNAFDGCGEVRAGWQAGALRAPPPHPWVSPALPLQDASQGEEPGPALLAGPLVVSLAVLLSEGLWCGPAAFHWLLLPL